MTAGTAGEGGARPATRRALGRIHRTTREIADDLLGHLPDLGDAHAQRAVDAWVDQAAETMRALTQSLEDRLLGSRQDSPPPGHATPEGTPRAARISPSHLPSAHTGARDQG
ncbi:MAG: hypothetical protein L0H25_03595 [Micrococcales bacterium]|nr:hypothetical protein [Micrococcales bacterium]